ncbi:hypothetical protein ASESINO_20 [Erwinia phage vB_EamM_Asesino]|uniref:Uncharacterized protein n=1 Tax=Erwinia phage vB_EamM_Asesino TaxID=1883370 RepID=A0A1B2I9S9_9CAUD|nr:hypothetical protein ASESINO_20 [Erwinia phage vB_EamM_Asesino]ANZ48033.1 hypothetical protein ASESINO_20 [Erwinia phage vB_EamM_Asesino]
MVGGSTKNHSLFRILYVSLQTRFGVRDGEPLSGCIIISVNPAWCVGADVTGIN